MSKRRVRWLSAALIVGLLLVACTTFFVLLSTTALAQNEEVNKEVVRRFFEEVAEAGRVEVIDETHHPEFHFEGVGGRGGIEENKELNRAFHTIWSDIEFAINEMIAEGDVVMGSFTVNATYLGGIEGASESAIGSRVSWGGYFHFRFRDGQIIENFWLRDEPALNRQLGISSQGEEEP